MENILSCVRIKPICTKGLEEEVICEKIDNENGVLVFRTQERYNFEMVFDENTETTEIFASIGVPLIDSCFEGINVCIFAYGQTSSGKTFTMVGDLPEKPGIIPQTIKEIFTKIGELQAKGTDVEIRISHIEIYNEAINDLLNVHNKNLDIRENLVKGVHIPGLTEHLVKSEKEAMEWFAQGEGHRIVGDTRLNEFSSRSHVVFRIGFEIRNRDRLDKVTYSTLSLIDLAGSEGVSRAKTEGLRKREGANINKSLLALSNVISRLASKEISYINYRDSKLTRLLQPSLGGNSRTVVICTISPLMSNFQETINTLKFGLSAGAVRNYVKANERYSGGVSGNSTLSSGSLGVAFQKEISDLKEEIMKLRMELDERSQNEVEVEAQTVDLKEELRRKEKEILEIREDREKLASKLSFEQRNSKALRDENQQLVFMLGDLENGTRKILHDNKIGEITRLYSQLEERTLDVERENGVLKQTVISLQGELNGRDEHFREIEKKLATLTEQKENMMAIEHRWTPGIGNQASHNHNVPKSKQVLPLFPRTQSFFGDSTTLMDPELRDLELTSSLNAKLMKKNQELVDIETKCSKLMAEVAKKEERIFELEIKLMDHRGAHGVTPARSDLGTESTSKCGRIYFEESSELKKAKTGEGEYDYVHKRIHNSPGKEDLKKEIGYLRARNKNLQSFVEKRKTALEEYVTRIQELLQRNIELENKLLFYTTGCISNN